jgi:hypothetical protein
MRLHFRCRLAQWCRGLFCWCIEAATLLKGAVLQLQNESIEQRKVMGHYCESISQTLEEIRSNLVEGKRPNFALAKLQGLAWNFPKGCIVLNGFAIERWGGELVARWPQGDLIELMHDPMLKEEVPRLYGEAARAFQETAKLLRMS